MLSLTRFALLVAATALLSTTDAYTYTEHLRKVAQNLHDLPIKITDPPRGRPAPIELVPIPAQKLTKATMPRMQKPTPPTLPPQKKVKKKLRKQGLDNRRPKVPPAIRKQLEDKKRLARLQKETLLKQKKPLPPALAQLIDDLDDDEDDDDSEDDDDVPEPVTPVQVIEPVGGFAPIDPTNPPMEPEIVYIEPTIASEPIVESVIDSVVEQENPVI